MAYSTWCNLPWGLHVAASLSDCVRIVFVKRNYRTYCETSWGIILPKTERKRKMFKRRWYHFSRSTVLLTRPNDRLTQYSLALSGNSPNLVILMKSSTVHISIWIQYLVASRILSIKVNSILEGRQGAGGRTHLMSPATAAAIGMSKNSPRKLISVDFLMEKIFCESYWSCTWCVFTRLRMNSPHKRLQLS